MTKWNFLPADAMCDAIWEIEGFRYADIQVDGRVYQVVEYNLDDEGNVEAARFPTALRFRKLDDAKREVERMCAQKNGG